MAITECTALEITNQLLSAPAVERKQKFRIQDLPNVWDIGGEIEWLVDNLIPKSTVNLLSGESGCGKSTLTLALAGAVAHGNDFLNRPTIKSDVLIIDQENGPSVYHERLKRLHIADTPRLRVWGLWCNPEPTSADAAAIAEFARETQPLIIFDSLIAFHPGSEQDSSETRKYMQHFRRLTSHGATVLVIHHIGKGEKTKFYRGSSDIKASVDVAYLLSSSSNLESLSLEPFKSREGELKKIQMTLNDGHFVSSGDRDRELIQEIIREHPAINNGEILSKAKGISKNKTRQILEQGEQEGWLAISKGDKNAKLYTLNDSNA